MQDAGTLPKLDQKSFPSIGFKEFLVFHVYIGSSEEPDKASSWKYFVLTILRPGNGVGNARNLIRKNFDCDNDGLRRKITQVVL